MSTQKDLLRGRCRPRTLAGGGCLWAAAAAAVVVDHSNAENRKYMTHRLFFRLALVQPFTLEAEIPLADKQQPVAMGTMKTGIPNDR